MSFDKHFCSSPWIHMRINNSGTYEYCRWQSVLSQKTRVDFTNNIRNQSPNDYFKNNMAPLRTAFLNGESPPDCHECLEMDRYNKVSGRQRQLLKVGITSDNFSKTLSSSTYRKDFEYSDQNNGDTTRLPVDWQIDLGNYCNGACVFCNPEESSKLAGEFLQLGIIDKMPVSSWCNDPVLVKRFVDDLIATPNLKYLHFLGGETIITPGFKTILQELVNADVARNVSIGFTTNLSVWNQSIIDLLEQFEQVNLGMSIETLTELNNYVRWPIKTDSAIKIMDRWVECAKNNNWLIQLRITPTVLTVHEIDTVYDYAWRNGIAVESCNFIHEPKFMRIGVLPKQQRIEAKQRLQQWVSEHQTTGDKVINTRNPTMVYDQIVQDAESYINYLTDADDESHRFTELVSFLKRLESNRKNSILEYIPHYDNIFRSAGY